MINDSSRNSEGVQSETNAFVRVSAKFGYSRAWNFHSPTGFTALGLQHFPKSGSSINGLIFSVPRKSLAVFDEREVGYFRKEIPTEFIEFLTPREKHIVKGSSVYIYVPDKNEIATREFPICQTYVDVVLEGCLAHGEEFAQEFIETTKCWSSYFLNDAPFSRRPWLSRARYKDIDRLLQKNGTLTRFSSRLHPEDYSANWLASLRGMWGVPQRSRSFIRRDIKGLQYLQDRFAEGASELYITGLGGVGKSSLAVEYCHEEYSKTFGLVIWLRSETEQSLMEDLRNLAFDCGIKGLRGLKNEDIISEVKSRLFRSNCRWLIVMDNVTDYAMAQKHIPKGRGQVLITSQLQPPSRDAPTVRLECFTRLESCKYLQSAIDRTLNPASCEELAALLGDLPLALSVAAAYMKSADLTCKEYITKYKKQSSSIPDSVSNSLSLSIARILSNENVPHMDTLLRCLAFLSPEHVQKPLLLQLINSAEIQHQQGLKKRLIIFSVCIFTTIFWKPIFISGIILLITIVAYLWMSPPIEPDVDHIWSVFKKYSIITVRARRQGTIHRLFQQVLRSNLSSQNTNFYLSTSIHAIGQLWIFDPTETDSWQECLYLIEHLKTLAEHISPSFASCKEAACLLTDAASLTSLSMCAYNESKNLLQLALKFHNDERSLDAARTLHVLGKVERYRGDLEAAKKALVPAMNIRESLLGPSTPLASSYHELGVLALRLNDIDQARAHLTKSLQMREKVEDRDSDSSNSFNDKAATLHQMANIAIKVKDLDEAERLLREALGCNIKSSARALTCQTLAKVYQRRGQLAKAETYLQESLQLHKAAFGTDLHVSVASVYSQLASVNFSRKLYSKASEELNYALTLRYKIYGKDSTHQEIVRNHSEIGKIKRMQRQYEEAWSHFSKQRILLEKQNDFESELYIDSLRWLKGVAKDSGDREKEKEVQAALKCVLKRKRKRSSSNTACKKIPAREMCSEVRKILEIRTKIRRMLKQKAEPSLILQEIEGFDDVTDVQLRALVEPLLTMEKMEIKEFQKKCYSHCDSLRNGLRDIGIRVDDASV